MSAFQIAIILVLASSRVSGEKNMTLSGDILFDCANSEGNMTQITASGISSEVLPYLGACWAVDEVVDCIDKKRISDSHGKYDPIKIFPRARDVKRAYFIFCVQSFFQVQRLFGEASNPPDCKVDMVRKECKKATNKLAQVRMERAMAMNDVELARHFACDMLVQVRLCEASMLTKCYQPWAPIMELNLMEMGTSCLMKQNVNTSLGICSANAGARGVPIPQAPLMLLPLLVLMWPALTLRNTNI